MTKEVMDCLTGVKGDHKTPNIPQKVTNYQKLYGRALLLRRPQYRQLRPSQDIACLLKCLGIIVLFSLWFYLGAYLSFPIIMY